MERSVRPGSRLPPRICKLGAASPQPHPRQADPLEFSLPGSLSHSRTNPMFRPISLCHWLGWAPPGKMAVTVQGRRGQGLGLTVNKGLLPDSSLAPFHRQLFT